MVRKTHEELLKNKNIVVKITMPEKRLKLLIKQSLREDLENETKKIISDKTNDFLRQAEYDLRQLIISEFRKYIKDATDDMVDIAWRKFQKRISEQIKLTQDIQRQI